MRAALYARVSTVDQDCQIQLTDPATGLRPYAQRQGWETVEYVEKLSGKEGNRRPQLEKLIEDARLKKFNVVLTWKLDRFGRSTIDTLENIRKLDGYRVRFLCSAMNIDTDDKSPLGRFIIQILAAIAELERAFILERTITGYKAYRKDYAEGKVGKARHSKSGKDLDVGRPRKVFDRTRAKRMRSQGMSWRAIAKELGVPQSTVRAGLK